MPTLATVIVREAMLELRKQSGNAEYVCRHRLKIMVSRAGLEPATR